MNYVRHIRSRIQGEPVIFPGSMVLVYNDENKILLQLRSDTHDWGVIGGIMELGDSYEETAIRELYEETGLTAGKLEVIGHFSGKDSYFQYPNGDKIYGADLIFKATDIKGELKMDSESINLQFFTKEEIKQLNLNIVSRKILEMCFVI